MKRDKKPTRRATRAAKRKKLVKVPFNRRSTTDAYEAPSPVEHDIQDELNRMEGFREYMREIRRYDY